LKYATAYDLRRTFASRWAESGLDAVELMRIMRHASIETTLKFYVEFDVNGEVRS
jgi:integrase